MRHDGLPDIPKALKLTAEERRAAWEGKTLTALTVERLTTEQQFRREMDALTERNIEEHNSRE